MISIGILAVSVLPVLIALQNVALNKPARQIANLTSSTVASNAVDGDTDGNWAHGSCSSTPDVVNTWWQVDLMGFYIVYSVEVFRRTDCCEENFQNFEVRVSLRNTTTFPTSEGQQCAFQNTTIPATGALLTCSRPITGRYVTVYKPANHYLTMCEVKVYGERSHFTGLYSLAHRNSRAVVPSMTSLSASSLLTCATRCAKTSFCFAFNFMKTSSGTPLHSVTCELLNNGTFVDFQESITSLVQKANWTVYVLKYQ
ncbi:fucolectin-like [Pomacea canaliculata]|uniref:fucolectin-like n=1 Tax=Pomacea canaliculata TaxID=400727 RepID=UPI000D729BF9|nr:fucolectin-like [Pomacea canaliculata]